MACNERGMALISVLLMLSLLLALVQILSEKVWQSSRHSAEAALRQQAFWAAHAGIEWSRQQLAEAYRHSEAWQNCLAPSLGTNYPAAPLWTTEINGVAVELFVRDNADGDGDLLRDNDLKLFVLARARSAQGLEVLVESLCGFGSTVDPANYAQLGAPAGERATEVADQVDLSAQPVATYGLSD